MKKILGLYIIFSCFTGCATEKFCVRIVNQDGCPVSNAVVRLKTMNKIILFGSENPNDFDIHTTQTDENGCATIRFNCKNACFNWWVVLDGYYRNDSYREQFKFEDVIMPGYVGVILHEHEKARELVVYKKKNPQPMWQYGNIKAQRTRVPKKIGRYGFDLKVFDWLSPVGKGKDADFYYVQEKGAVHDESTLGSVIGRLEFAPGCGAYIKKKNTCKDFPAAYSADTNEIYQAVFPISLVADEAQGKLKESLILNKDEYMVIRSRIQADEEGNCLTAHYSEILGPFGFFDFILQGESIFNPRANDTNLEFDRSKNLNTEILPLFEGL